MATGKDDTRSFLTRFLESIRPFLRRLLKSNRGEITEEPPTLTNPLRPGIKIPIGFIEDGATVLFRCYWCNRWTVDVSDFNRKTMAKYGLFDTARDCNKDMKAKIVIRDRELSNLDNQSKFNEISPEQYLKEKTWLKDRVNLVRSVKCCGVEQQDMASLLNEKGQLTEGWRAKYEAVKRPPEP